MDQILIKDLLVRTVIGVEEHERSHLSDVLINLVIFTDFSRAGHSDDIDDCVNYATLTHQVQALVEGAARHTLEALAEDVARFCLEIPGVNGLRVRVEKPNVVHFTRLVGVEIERIAVSQRQVEQETKTAVSSGEIDRPQPESPREWKIRPAVVGDIPALVELRLGMFQSMGYSDPVDLEWLRRDSYEYMQKSLLAGEYLSWVADVNGKAVASGGLVIRTAPPTIRNHTGLEGYVISVFTEPQWRRQGIARAIMTAILDYLRLKGIPAVTLRATDDGRPLYLSLGFNPDGWTMALDLK
jgi:FolB domain-containing protein